MRIGIVRPAKGYARSMDVYAEGLVAGLRAVRPQWHIEEYAPTLPRGGSLASGVGKYVERFCRFPLAVSRTSADLYHIIDHSDAHITRWFRRTRRPVVVTCHDLVNFVDPENLRRESRIPALSGLSWRFSVRSMRRAAHVIAVSQSTASDTARFLDIPPAMVSVISSGVSPAFRQLSVAEVQGFRESRGVPTDTVCILNVGVVHKRKNIPAVLCVVKGLRDRGVRVRLWKAGSDFDHEQRVYIRDNGLNECVDFAGTPDIHELVRLYNAADVLLSPSLYEGFGLTVVEAMACGTPVIASNTYSLPEITGDAAILTDPHDTESMVEAVCLLRGNAEYRQRLIGRGITQAKLFSWTETAERTAAVYERVIEERRCRRN